MAGTLTYSVPEAARLLGISDDHAYRMVRAGKLPSRRLGQRIVIPKAALRRWLDQAAS